MRKIPGIALLILLSVCSGSHANTFLPSGHIAMSSTRMALPHVNKLQSLEELADNLFMANGPILDSIATLSEDQMKSFVQTRTGQWQHALNHATGLTDADRKKAIAYGKVKILLCKNNFAFYNRAAKDHAVTLVSWVLDGQDLNDPALAAIDPGTLLNFVGCFISAKEQEANAAPAGNNTARFNKYKYLLASNCPDAAKQKFLDNSLSFQFRNNYCSPELSALMPEIHQGIKDPAIIHYFEALLVRYHQLDRGQPAPDFTLVDCNGKTVKLSDFRGKKVVIEIWSTSCAACLKAMPIYDSLVAANDFPNTVFLKIAMDQLKDKSDVTGEWRDYIISKHMDLTTNLIASDVEQLKAIKDAYAMGDYGHYFVIDKDGKIISLNHQNPLDPELFKDIKE